MFDLKVISYNLNALPFGASLLGGPGHEFRDVRLHEFVARPELRECTVLLLQEVFATPVLRGVLCSQAWLRRQLAELGFVHQVPYIGLQPPPPRVAASASSTRSSLTLPP